MIRHRFRAPKRDALQCSKLVCGRRPSRAALHCLFACLLVCLFACLLACLFACLLACLLCCLLACLFACLLVCLFACLLACLLACLPVLGFDYVLLSYSCASLFLMLHSELYGNLCAITYHMVLFCERHSRYSHNSFGFCAC